MSPVIHTWNRPHLVPVRVHVHWLRTIPRFYEIRCAFFRPSGGWLLQYSVPYRTESHPTLGLSINSLRELDFRHEVFCIRSCFETSSFSSYTAVIRSIQWMIHYFPSYSYYCFSFIVLLLFLMFYYCFYSRRWRRVYDGAWHGSVRRLHDPLVLRARLAHLSTILLRRLRRQRKQIQLFRRVRVALSAARACCQYDRCPDNCCPGDRDRRRDLAAADRCPDHSGDRHRSAGRQLGQGHWRSVDVQAARPSTYGHILVEFDECCVGCDLEANSLQKSLMEYLSGVYSYDLMSYGHNFRLILTGKQEICRRRCVS